MNCSSCNKESDNIICKECSDKIIEKLSPDQIDDICKTIIKECEQVINEEPKDVVKIGTNQRKIFVGGLKTPDNLKMPPENSGLYFLDFTSPSNDTSIVIGDVVRNAVDHTNPKEIHIYEPNNIVIGDFNWLKANWHKVEQWYKSNNSVIDSCTLSGYGN